ncbi:N-formylglutamate amidohydrolase [Caenimonas sedimenti]|uniref:N-formylglutamate amidohydrolase n=1 Tax=Caenimonas sedimenti TaxID=2596921 RepID=A0A562ZYK2_9BURK|nr:N-formylglutamate amidohydrolase [Caenimonas sedimenti]
MRHRALHPEREETARSLIRTSAGTTALVFDSPHSGTCYPADFDHACDLAALRRAEDTHVEKLFDFAPALGISWVEALFPRSYLDVNRHEGEIDLSMIEGPWRGLVESDPTALAKVRLGKGLVWKLTDDGLPLYARKLSAAEVSARIERCWRPYHAAVAEAIAGAHARHGFSLHVNCHSMPAIAASHATEHPGLVHADFVLGDRDGTTASPKLAALVAEWLRGRGYTVWLNHPYKGVDLVRRHGHPAARRHSIQLEVNRKLYMDEETLVLHAGSERLQRHLRELAGELLRLRAMDLA